MFQKFTDIRKFQIDSKRTMNNESNLTDKMLIPYINDKIECLFVYVVNLIICKHGHFSVQKYQTGINSTRLRFAHSHVGHIFDPLFWLRSYIRKERTASSARLFLNVFEQLS